jgi:hypothetical protein
MEPKLYEAVASAIELLEMAEDEHYKCNLASDSYCDVMAPQQHPVIRRAQVILHTLDGDGQEVEETPTT